MLDAFILSILCGCAATTYSVALQSGNAFSFLRDILYTIRRVKYIGKVSLILGLCEYCFSFWLCLSLQLCLIQSNVIVSLVAAACSSATTMVLAKYLDEND